MKKITDSIERNLDHLHLSIYNLTVNDGEAGDLISFVLEDNLSKIEPRYLEYNERIYFNILKIANKDNHDTDDLIDIVSEIMILIVNLEKDLLIQALKNKGVKMSFPEEFGLDEDFICDECCKDDINSNVIPFPGEFSLKLDTVETINDIGEQIMNNFLGGVEVEEEPKLQEVTKLILNDKPDMIKVFVDGSNHEYGKTLLNYIYLPYSFFKDIKGLEVFLLDLKGDKSEFKLNVQIKETTLEDEIKSDVNFMVYKVGMSSAKVIKDSIMLAVQEKFNLTNKQLEELVEFNLSIEDLFFNYHLDKKYFELMKGIVLYEEVMPNIPKGAIIEYDNKSQEEKDQLIKDWSFEFRELR